jgi:hypothetical protein
MDDNRAVTIVVKTGENEGDEFTKVLSNENVWSQSTLIKDMLSLRDGEEGEDEDYPIHLAIPHQKVRALNRVLEWMEGMAGFEGWRREAQRDGKSEERRKWINTYMERISVSPQRRGRGFVLLFMTIEVANYMAVEVLLDELCKYLANMMATRTPLEISRDFDIEKPDVDTPAGREKQQELEQLFNDLKLDRDAEMGPPITSAGRVSRYEEQGGEPDGFIYKDARQADPAPVPSEPAVVSEPTAWSDAEKAWMLTASSDGDEEEGDDGFYDVNEVEPPAAPSRAVTSPGELAAAAAESRRRAAYAQAAATPA